MRLHCYAKEQLELDGFQFRLENMAITRFGCTKDQRMKISH